MVTGEKVEGETDDSGGWILVGGSDPLQIQRKARKEVESRWPNQVEFLGCNGVDMILRTLRDLEEKKKPEYLESYKAYLDKEEKERVRKARMTRRKY